MISKVTKKLRNKKGFTLIELIVVLAVLSIIMSIAVPRFIGVQADAERRADNVTVEMIGRAAELYYLQNSNTGNITANALVPNYLDSISLKTGTYGNENGSSLNITYNNGLVRITYGTGAKEVYPNNELDNL